MRNFYKILVVLGFFLAVPFFNLFAQVGINADNSSPNESAMLDVKSANKGLLPPRMTHAEMNAIVNPANGLIIYCSDCSNSGNGALAMFISGAWYMFAPICIVPLIPSVGIHIPASNQITWNWNPVTDATGYKWNTINDYGLAIDMSKATTKSETGLICNTPYIRYAWAYNTCGNSAPVTLTQSTSVDPPATPTAGTHVPLTTQITWNWNTVINATGYKWNTVNDYAGATDMGTATTKVETGLTCNTPYTRYVWAYSVCGNSTPIILTQSTLACSFTCGSSITINHVVSGGVAPVDKTVTYGTVNSIPGELTKCWITRNLGAAQQATVVSDATEASAGWYFQFNRKQGYQYISSRIPATTWITSISESSNWITANDPCIIELGIGWRIPTNTEWTNVGAGWTNWNGPFSSALILHAAGSLSYIDGSLYNRGSNGIYWCSTQADAPSGWNLNFGSFYSVMDNGAKSNGFSARCVKDF